MPPGHRPPLWPRTRVPNPRRRVKRERRRRLRRRFDVFCRSDKVEQNGEPQKNSDKSPTQVRLFIFIIIFFTFDSTSANFHERVQPTRARAPVRGTHPRRQVESTRRHSATTRKWNQCTREAETRSPLLDGGEPRAAAAPPSGDLSGSSDLPPVLTS